MTRPTVSYRLRLERLIRHVRRPEDRGSAHACTLGVFEQVVDYLEDHRDGATLQAIWRALALPRRQVRVAVGFLVARGLLARRGRRLYPRPCCLEQRAREQFCLLALTGR